MCSLFTSQDPTSYASETRAMRLHGHVTSLRLEAAFWDILEQIAERERMPLSRFIAILHDEILDKQGEVANFASFLRVTCAHWLRNQDAHEARLDAKRAAIA